MKAFGYDIIMTMAIILLATATTACRENELCYNHYSSADIAIDWEQEWERDYGMNHALTWDTDVHGFDYHTLRPEKPEWVNLLRYSEEGSVSEKNLAPDGGQFILTDESSSHSYLLYNGDTEYIVFQDMAQLAEARATTTSRSRATITHMLERHPDTRSINPPDILFSAYIDNVPKVETHEVRSIPVKMQPLVYTYVVRYEFEHGLEHVALARGALGGMAESVYLRTGATPDRQAIILYDCELKPWGCEAQVRSFGVPGFPDKYYGKSTTDIASANAVTLNLELRLNNGNTVEYNYDISDQLARQPRGGVITISGIRVEDEESLYESGFDVNVSGWGPHEDIDLPVTSVP